MPVAGVEGDVGAGIYEVVGVAVLDCEVGVRLEVLHDLAILGFVVRHFQ